MWGMDAAGNGGLRGTCCPGLSPGHRRAGSPPRLGPSGGQSLLRVTKTERTVHVLVSTNTTQAVTHFNTQLFPVSSRGERGRALTTPCLLCCPPSTGRGGCRCPAGPACEEEKQSLTVRGLWLEPPRHVHARPGQTTAPPAREVSVAGRNRWGRTHQERPFQNLFLGQDLARAWTNTPSGSRSGWCPVGSGLCPSASPGLGGGPLPTHPWTRGQKPVMEFCSRTPPRWPLL